MEAGPAGSGQDVERGAVGPPLPTPAHLPKHIAAEETFDQRSKRTVAPLASRAPPGQGAWAHVAARTAATALRGRGGLSARGGGRGARGGGEVFIVLRYRWLFL